MKGFRKILLISNFILVAVLPIFIASFFELNPFSSWPILGQMLYVLLSLWTVWFTFGSTMVLLGKSDLFMKQYGRHKIPLHFPPYPHWLNIPKRIRPYIWKAEQPWHKYAIGDEHEFGKPWHLFRVVTIMLALIGIAYLIYSI